MALDREARDPGSKRWHQRVGTAVLTRTTLQHRQGSLMHQGQIFVVIIIAIITSGITLSAIAQAWAASRRRGGPAASLPRLDAIEARLSRMEEMIESVAIEMERVAEGQRFTAKLLSDRAVASQSVAARPVSQAESRITTPR